MGARRSGHRALSDIGARRSGALGARLEACAVNSGRLLFSMVLVAAACRSSPVQPCPTQQVAAYQAQGPALPSPFDSLFATAGAEFHVPPALLASIGWAETRWQMVRG